jgi:predicted CXXCH cytochrome family protein
VAPSKGSWLKGLLSLLLIGGAVTVGGALVLSSRYELPPSAASLKDPPRKIMATERLTLWWDELPAGVRKLAEVSGQQSNVHRSDYVGPDACKHCHRRNYESWSGHPHRWMNALADRTTVKGDFSGRAAISYRGGHAAFDRQDDKLVMHLERGGVRRTYEVHQTIGSRFFQYYVGKQVGGPEAAGHHFYTRDHVLPFGYWLDQQEWVPVVHIGPEVADAQRPDPYDPPADGPYYADYAAGCNSCHTTFPLADLIGRKPHQVGAHSPMPLHWSMRRYLERDHADMVSAVAAQLDQQGMKNPMAGWEASRYAVTLGVSCEACHLGAREHVESGGQVLPQFFPASPCLSVETKGAPLDFGRTHANVNWACGRCHTGGRPQFAAGMSTWNSVEYADAARGSCYSKLRCIDCHNPHRAIGPKWSLAADQDDALCLKCHEQLRPADKRVQHTHHPIGSDGARCMNCHMPRINEGLQDVVRTHMIYSPTRADMLEANHPNACNLCHTDRSIGWTLGYLKQWYGATYDERKIASNDAKAARPAALGWLASDNPAVRLVAAEALTRARDFKALPQLLNALDDPYLVNRQFAAKGLQAMLSRRLGDFGYHFYMTAEERRGPLAAMRGKLRTPGGQAAP